MTELEKMERYVEKTKMHIPHSYQLNWKECKALVKEIRTYEGFPLDAVLLAFKYGAAKATRMMRAERCRK